MNLGGGIRGNLKGGYRKLKRGLTSSAPILTSRHSHALPRYELIRLHHPLLCPRMRYPPFTQSKLKCLQWLLTPGRKSMFPWKLFSFILLVALVAVLTQTFGLPNWIYRFWDK